MLPVTSDWQNRIGRRLRLRDLHVVGMKNVSRGRTSGDRLATGAKSGDEREKLTTDRERDAAAL
jgi:hypothetical protein